MLNCWVTETKENAMSIEQLSQFGEVTFARPHRQVDIIDDDNVNHPGAAVVE